MIGPTIAKTTFHLAKTTYYLAKKTFYLAKTTFSLAKTNFHLDIVMPLIDFIVRSRRKHMDTWYDVRYWRRRADGKPTVQEQSVGSYLL